MKTPAFLRRLSPSVAAILLALGLLAFSARLLSLQAQAIRAIADSGVPVLQRLPQAEERRRILSEQLEIAEVEQAMRGGTHDDLVRAFALPADADLDRLLSALDAALTALGAADRAPITVEDGEPAEDGLSARIVRVRATFDAARADDLLALLPLTGTVSVGDALTPAQRALLLSATEKESPESLTAVESFFAADLLRYAREPKPVEEALRRSFADPDFPTLLDLLVRESALADARRLLSGPIGDALADGALWPTRLLTLKRGTMERGAEGAVVLTLDLEAWGRE